MAHDSRAGFFSTIFSHKLLCVLLAVIVMLCVSVFIAGRHPGFSITLILASLHSSRIDCRCGCRFLTLPYPSNPSTVTKITALCVALSWTSTAKELRWSRDTKTIKYIGLIYDFALSRTLTSSSTTTLDKPGACPLPHLISSCQVERETPS